MKRIMTAFALMLVGVMTTFGFCACNNGSHEHVFKGAWHRTQEGHARQCEICDVVDEYKPHDYNDGTLVLDPTCFEEGQKEFVCRNCGYKFIEYISKTPHTLGPDGVCTVCGGTEEEITWSEDKKFVYIGAYPQMQVTDPELTSKLEEEVGAPPSSESDMGWPSYGYYIGNGVTNYMWYNDVTYGGEKYRAVYFIQLRPNSIDASSSAQNSYQDDNGFEIYHFYWFKFEPIKWRVLSNSNGQALLMSDMILDAQEYHDSSNNYKTSAVRTYLNMTFYNTAFGAYSKNAIVKTHVDNSVESTGFPENNFVCDDTDDNVFLLSTKEVMTASFGFAENMDDSASRQLLPTDYAKVQGVKLDNSGYGRWWLRSPDYFVPFNAEYVDEKGNCNHGDSAPFCANGIVPAITIKAE